MFRFSVVNPAANVELPHSQFGGVQPVAFIRPCLLVRPVRRRDGIASVPGESQVPVRNRRDGESSRNPRRHLRL